MGEGAGGHHQTEGSSFTRGGRAKGEVCVRVCVMCGGARRVCRRLKISPVCTLKDGLVSLARPSHEMACTGMSMLPYKSNVSSVDKEEQRRKERCTESLFRSARTGLGDSLCSRGFPSRPKLVLRVKD